MNSEELTLKIRSIVASNGKENFKGAEEYYFALGQILCAVFIEMGGFDKYRKEFNYLTNPYIPSSIQKLCFRILSFLGKYEKFINIHNNGFKVIKELLFSQKQTFTCEAINKVTCESAFYSGLYSDNIFI
jgi:hypothetical protein